MDPETVDDNTGLIHVLKTMQISSSKDKSNDVATLSNAVDGLSVDNSKDFATSPKDEPTPYPHIFAIGDAADAFGAIPAGHNAYTQASKIYQFHIRKDE